jgi:hypothetical protein
LDSVSVLRRQLEQHISKYTGRRVRDLAVEVYSERIVVRGRTRSYYVKQLAQHGVRDILPDVRLENAIHVEGAA